MSIKLTKYFHEYVIANIDYKTIHLPLIDGFCSFKIYINSLYMKLCYSGPMNKLGRRELQKFVSKNLLGMLLLAHLLKISELEKI